MAVPNAEKSSIYHQNISILKSRFPDIADLLEGIEPSNFRVQPARMSGLTLRSIDGVTFHSRVDPIREAKDFVRARGISNGGRWMIFGFGLGYHLQAAMTASSAPDELIAIEFCPEILKVAMGSVDLSDLLQWERFQLWLPGGIPPLEQRIIELAGEVNIAVHPPSLAWWRRQKLPLADILDIIEIERMNWQHSGSAYQEAVTQNSSALAVCENAVSFFNDLHDQPIMVIGAGPSLDDAKPSIKQYRSSLFVLAVNAAFKPLRDAGIQPDAVICIEPRPEAKASFDGLGEEEIPLLFVPGTNPDVMRNWKGPKLVASQQKEESLPHTGTVVGAALDVAIRLGGNPIILTGVDLALVGDWYAKGVEKSQSEAAGKLLASNAASETQQNPSVYQVVGIDGAMVPSTQAFRHFIHSLEKLIEDARRRHPHLKIYDMKARGAKINGTQSLPPSGVSMETILGDRIIKNRSKKVGDYLSTGVRP